MNPIISVIVPIYKVEQYIRRCINSIISQTYRNLEIILVDDGSPDNCGKICDEYAEKDNRIIVIHKQNGGLGRARNTGIEIFKGQYVMFVDADDYLSLDCVEVLYTRITEDNCEIAVGNYIKIFDNDVTKAGFCRCPEGRVMSRADVLSSYKPHLIYVTAWGKLYRHDIIKNISYPTLRCGEDTWVFGDIIKQCNRISFVNRTLYFYYQRLDSIVHSPDEGRQVDSINADLQLSSYLVQEGCCENASILYASCIDRALSLDKVEKRIGLFKQHFDRKTREKLLSKTDFETKLKWLGLFIPFSDRIRKVMISAKRHLSGK